MRPEPGPDEVQAASPPVDRGARDDRPVRWRRAIAFASLGLAGFALQALCAASPETTERLYSRGVYPQVQRALAALSGWSPIALGEVLLLGLLLLGAVAALRALAAWRRGQRRLRNLAGRGVAHAAGAFGVAVLAFQLLWGLNHARQPFATQLGLAPQAATPAELARLARQLTERAAAARPSGREPLAGYLDGDWRRSVLEAFDRAGRELPALAGPRPAIRTPWISPLMTLASVTGIYSPFTGEPNVNGHMPEIVRPFVACHEVAHQRGFAREDEANFIAWWVGARSPDAGLAYSCELQALRIALAELYRVDPGAWRERRDALPPALRADLAAIREFWLGQPETAQRVLTGITGAANDAYLKSAGHADGVRSYGRMVDLLVATLGDA